jgi:pyruvate dehydrogenase E2 component (dihydrolipoamide acetyltransferase)
VYDDGILASPVVRMFAKERNVDIERVRGSGRKGRILKEDVLALLEGKQKQKISS